MSQKEGFEKRKLRAYQGHVGCQVRGNKVEAVPTVKWSGPVVAKTRLDLKRPNDARFLSCTKCRRRIHELGRELQRVSLAVMQTCVANLVQ